MASFTIANDSVVLKSEACMLAYVPNTALPQIGSFSFLLDSFAFYDALAEASTGVLCR